MSLSRLFPAVLGCFAIGATAATLVLELILAYGSWSSESPLRIVAVIASVIEVIVLILLGTLLANHAWYSSDRRSAAGPSGVWFAVDLIAGVLATIASVALLILTGKATDLPKMILGVSLTNVRIGTSVALGFAFVGQLLFVVLYFIIHRRSDLEQAHSLHTNEEGRFSPQLSMRVKTVRYDRTKPALPRAQSTDQSSFEYSSRPGTSGGRSTAETVSSMTGSVASTVRPMGSKTRLLSTSSRTARRPGSLDSNAYREQNSIAEDVSEGFDSWDTSSVDPHNRLMVLETSSSPNRPRFLETIPASPTPSRSPSPGFPLDLEPPSRVRRGRSNSPVPRAPRERTLTPQASESELHIHPLFRSDSPVPPATSPGTVLVAAPNAGQFITGKSITRMRSGSLPSSPSPLSRQGSYDSFRKTPSPYDDGLRPEEVGEERKMTPPIPEWVLTAGSKSSLGEYPSKGQVDASSQPNAGKGSGAGLR
ncbi:hypothetical protein F5Y18DRAFT_60398 [Xylariaceae sp. FL1019]|nr:hypothetical protein F5Y18DRAFT_60398 [Xylariaceae sp. FL1019]